jgi:hypothetical protein
VLLEVSPFIGDKDPWPWLRETIDADLLFKFFQDVPELVYEEFGHGSWSRLPPYETIENAVQYWLVARGLLGMHAWSPRFKSYKETLIKSVALMETQAAKFEDFIDGP